MILGVDPGTRNIGFVVIDGGGRCVKRRVLANPTRSTFVQCVKAVVREMGDLQVNLGYDTVVVEETVWQGRKGMLPLAHVGGAVMGAALAMGCRVYLLTPSMKKNGKKPKSWSDHEFDAFLLAKRALAPDETMRKRCSG